MPSPIPTFVLEVKDCEGWWVGVGVVESMMTVGAVEVEEEEEVVGVDDEMVIDRIDGEADGVEDEMVIDEVEEEVDGDEVDKDIEDDTEELELELEVLRVTISAKVV
ncbi:hypothetical protein ABVK25_005039 [Lepraria finkii]|uniref:Uncharacterized protein n=1 Tax=Lepraria finkii TaxID=1340010 RepID=A0ABR4BAR9_9LECA